MKKLQFAIAGLALIAGITTLLVIQRQAAFRLRLKDRELERQASRIVQLEADNARLSNPVVATNKAAPLPEDLFNELLRLRGEVLILRFQLAGKS